MRSGGPLVPALCELEASLAYIERPCLGRRMAIDRKGNCRLKVTRFTGDCDLEHNVVQAVVELPLTCSLHDSALLCQRGGVPAAPVLPGTV